MITVESLTRRYAGFTAVDNVSFTALPGRVTGFLGPNGAGKSTTMRVMVGLTVPTSGTVTINGERFVDLPNPGLEVGVLLDASAQHAGRTGREILTIAADTMGLPRRRRRDARARQPDIIGSQAPRARPLPRHASATGHRHRARSAQAYEVRWNEGKRRLAYAGCENPWESKGQPECKAQSQSAYC